MAIFMKDVWNSLRSHAKPERTMLIVVPSRSYMVQMLAHMFDDAESTRIRHHNMFCVRVQFLKFDAIVVVQNYLGVSLVERIHDMTVGRIDIDLWLVDSINVGTNDRRALQQIMSARMGTFSTLESK